MNILTWNEVKQIFHQLYLEHAGISEEILCEDISRIVYCSDVIDCGSATIIHRHIDIEYSFGDFCEICEDTLVFQSICTLCRLPLLNEKKDIVLYQKQNGDR